MHLFRFSPKTCFVLQHSVNSRTLDSLCQLLIGAVPATDWLPDEIARDDWGFVLTGRDVEDGGVWPLARSPLPFETSLPGTFAVGDVRYGSVKRVASAVGEGSVAVQSVHRFLADAGVGAPA